MAGHKKARWRLAGLVVLFLVALQACVWKPGAAPQGEKRTSPYIVADVFQAFYTSVPNPEFVFGLPISPLQQRPDGTWVQYFEKAVFVTDATEQVRLEPLGKRFRIPGEPYLTHAQRGPHCRTYPTGYAVCYAFLEVYLKYNGERIFGMPISGIETDGLQIFQDFENARLLFRFEAPERIVVADLGRMALEQDMGSRPPGGPVHSPRKPEKLQLQVQVNTPVVAPGETLIVTLLALDQDMKPVEGLDITVELFAEDGFSLGVQHVGATDAHGLLQFGLQAPQDHPGRLYLEARARYNGHLYIARRMFRVSSP